MVHGCVMFLLMELGAADPISQRNTVSIKKVKSVDCLNASLVALVGFGCGNAPARNKERTELCSELYVRFLRH